jgi:hypothetical protein
MVNLQVSGPGIPAQVATRWLSQDFEVVLEGLSGRVVLSSDVKSWMYRYAVLLVHRDGGFLEIFNGLDRGSWAQPIGTKVVIPQLAAGSWHAVLVSAPDSVLFSELMRGALRGVTLLGRFDVLPGAQLDLPLRELTSSESHETAASSSFPKP